MNSSKVTIVMYHYVRDLKNSRFPGIKGLDIRLFEEQIAYLKKHYNFITMELLVDALENNHDIPEKAVLLTFDDAYSDHYEYVLPVLLKNRIQGSFFPPAKAILEHIVLDVNKIHFILAAQNDHKKLLADVFDELKKYRKDYNLNSDAFYYNKLAKPNRFDTPEVVFVKLLLQVELEEGLRKIITNNLFEKIISIPEESFSRELYMDISQIRILKQNGMFIGSHGYDHYWLGSLTREMLSFEIEKSLEFLGSIGCNIADSWVMCYPYGDYNDFVIEVLREYNCSLALTTDVDIADISTHNRFTLPRLDTNDIPKNRDAEPDKWY